MMCALPLVPTVVLFKKFGVKTGKFSVGSLGESWSLPAKFWNPISFGVLVFQIFSPLRKKFFSYKLYSNTGALIVFAVTTPDKLFFLESHWVGCITFLMWQKTIQSFFFCSVRIFSFFPFTSGNWLINPEDCAGRFRGLKQWGKQ